MIDNTTPRPSAPLDGVDLSRRTLLGRGMLLAAAGLGGPALLAACGSDDAGTAATTGAGGSTALPADTTTAATAAGTAGSEPSSDLVIKAVRTDPMKKFEFRGQIFVRGNIWSDAMESGWKQAAKDFGINIEAGGPMTVDPADQVAQLESWILQKVDCIMVTAADPSALTPSLNKAVAAGIPVITIDSDAPGSNRQVFNTGANAQALAFAQIDSLATQMNEEGEWAFIIGELTQVEKQYQFEQMKARALEKYPKMTFVGIEECKDDQQKAADLAQALIVRNPNLGGIISNSGGGCVGAAQGISASGKSGKVKVTGLTFPSSGRQYVLDGTMPEFFIWNVAEQGYFAAALGISMLTGQDIVNGAMINRWTDDPRPTALEVSSDDPTKIVAVLGPPLKIDSSNVETLGP